MSSMDFGEKIHPTDRIREVLNSYPFSTTIIRELLANSDDAQATKQSIVLDRTRHPSARICDPIIADTQGPALLAYNNSIFKKEDWDAIQFIGHSSKAKSTSKIGKFGLGIRSCYHVTDYLQILSGENLLIFDPLRSFSKHGGILLPFNRNDIEDVRDHFTAFKHFLPEGWNGERFDGTIVRLPLRTQPGLREKIVSPNDIEELFTSFIINDLNICLLFVNHLRSIEFHVVDEQGVSRMAQCVVAVEQGVFDKKAVRLERNGVQSKEEWLMIHEVYPDEEVLATLASRVGTSSLAKVLEGSKLCPHVSIAFPLLAGQTGAQPIAGQLFTFLPLPVKTGFPAHVHALFALDSSRQHLCMNRDKGTMQGSENQIFDEWNRVLFQTVIPHAWSRLLGVVAESQIGAPFSAWPNPHCFAKDGESAFWSSFTQDVLSIVLAKEPELAVWPALGGGCLPLGTVFIFSDDVSVEVARALAAVGLRVCGPVPSHLFNALAKNPKWKHRILTPENASANLRVEHLDDVLQAQDGRHRDLELILEYLLSTGGIENIIGLPIIPTVSSQYVALSASTAASSFTLLDRTESDLFNGCDPHAICSGDLPESTQIHFTKSAPIYLNLKLLDATRIVQYLALHPTRHGVDLSSTQPNDAATHFLVQFWVWLGNGGRRHATALLPQLRSVKLLPCVGGGLQEADGDRPVFDSAEVEGNSALLTSLCNLGVPMLSSRNTDSRFKSTLREYGLLKSPCVIKDLLYCLGYSEAASAASLPSDQSRQLLAHFNTHMPKQQLASYDATDLRSFRQLPIFPIVELTEGNGQLNLRRRLFAIEGLTVYGAREEYFDMLPDLPNVVFVDASMIDHQILCLLNNQNQRRLTEMRILEITIERNALRTQPRRVLAAILGRVAQRQMDLTGTLRERLRSEAFVVSEAGTTETPRRLIDPSSPLRPFYETDRDRLPCMANDADKRVVDSLSSIGLFDRALSKENVEDRIQYIAANAHFDFATRLLNVLFNFGFPCNSLNIDRSLAWLPTQKGTLASGDACRPEWHQGTVHDSRLFDKVLERITSRVPTVPPSLRAKLRWDEPIPVDVLIRQLDLVLAGSDNDRVARVEVVIQELGKRRLSSAQWNDLTATLNGKAWVPVSAASGEMLVKVWQAVFSLEVFDGVYRIKASHSEGGRRFLRQLGCLDEPSFATVKQRLEELETVQRSQPSADIVASVLEALRFCFRRMTLEGEQLDQLLIPDQRGHLHHRQKVIFNDIGPNSLMISLPADRHLANNGISSGLAEYLGLEFLGLEYIDLNTLGEDMGASPEALVRESLADYQMHQFLPEFLANADDAGARTFEVILSDQGSSEGNFLSEPAKRLCTGPCVMVCNDRLFTDADFDGICRTRTGGKTHNQDSIGQFGLGSLTMFHITECAFIFSGTKMLVLDPSKFHLPLVPKRASALLNIPQVMHLYPGHFNRLQGVSYFDRDAQRVNGTIFLLPLRTTALASERRALSPRIFEDATRSFRAAALADFERKAPDTLLFIENVEHIGVSESRSWGAPPQRIWSITAQRSKEAHEDFIECKVSISSTLGRGQEDPIEWLIVAQKLDLTSIPEDLRGKARKSVRTGLAALLHAPERVSRRFQPTFYSMLPLPIAHTLPVHINASFILSSDRRNIRSDTYDNDASRFNYWILEENIPQLYLALLECLGRLDGGQDNARWWPGAHLKSSGDQGAHVARGSAVDLSTRLTHKFYLKHLPASGRRVFTSIFSHQPLTSREAVIQPSENLTPSAVIRSYRILQPDSLVRLSSACRKRSEEAGVAIAGPDYLKQVLLNEGALSVIRQELAGHEVREVLSYISSSSVTLLHGLALLRLEDLSWATFGPETAGSTRYFLCQEREHYDASVFPPSLFVSPGFINPALLELARRQAQTSLNVALLDAAGIRHLVQDRLRNMASGTKEEWVNAFWKRFPRLPQDGLLEAIKDLPLIPTSAPASFKSLQEFQDGEILLLTHGETAEAGFYGDLGMMVLSTRNLPSGLRSLLHYGEYAPKGRALWRVLRCIMPRIDTAVPIIQGWPLQRQAQFSEHVQSLMLTVSGELPKELLATARRLPLWFSRRGDEIKYCSADDTSLLPISLPIAVGRFCSSFVTDNANSAKIGQRHLTLTQLHSRLRPPARLDEGEEERAYYLLVSQLVTLDQVRRGRWQLSVPRADRMLVSPDDLYERAEFFVAAFGPSSSHFLLPSFDGLATHLPVTRNSELSMDLFVRCALSFQAEDEDRGVGRVSRAAVLFRVYSERLPLQIQESQSRQWQLADGIRFIPRNSDETTREWAGIRVELPATLTSLPHIVAPQKIVLKKYHAIAWTQRVTMANEPQVGSRLLLAYQSFGCPSGREVIAHLRALAADYPRGPVVQHDLKETYKWLNDHADSLKYEIMAVRDQAIFLNVDDMNDGDWNWCSAAELALETHDVAGFQPVRRFLRQFRALIKAADILEAKYPKFAKESQATIEQRDNQSLRAMRDAMNVMRRTGQRTDVHLIPSDSDLTDRNALRAHRVFLMACNPWFKAMFNEGFLEGHQQTDDATIGQSTQFSLEALLEFYYTGTLHFDRNPDLGDLQDTLSLAHYIQDDAFLLCVQREIIDRQIVDPLTVHDVLHQAETLHASLLKQWCEDYVAQNPVYIRRLTEEGRLDLDALN